jgi:hypothetical protein
VVQLQNKQQEQYEAYLSKLRTLSGSQAEQEEANRHFVWFFTFVLLVVEALNVYMPAFSLLLHLVLLQVLIAYISLHWRYPAQRKLLVLAIPSLMRILLLGLPLEDYSSITRWAIQGAGTLTAAIVLALTLHLHWEDLGINRKNLLIQVAIALTGIIFGLSFSILAPFGIRVDGNNTNLLMLEGVVVFGLGMLDAFIFQGLILHIINSMFKNRLYAPFFVAVIYTSLYLSLVASAQGLPYLFLIFFASLFYALLTSMSRNVIGACLAYGLLNLVLFVIVPMGWLSFIF